MLKDLEVSILYTKFANEKNEGHEVLSSRNEQ